MKKENVSFGNRMTWVDALKGIAICGVIMAHIEIEGAGIIDNIRSIGRNGVQMFFLLSAFLAFASYEKRLDEQEKSKRTYIIWIIQRIVRLVPLYYISILAAGIFLGGQSYWLGGEKNITIGNVMMHIMFLHGLFPHYINSIIGGEWYLGTLIIFYLLIPYLYKLIDSLEKSIIWFMSSAIICKLLSTICSKLTLGFLDSYIYGTYFENFWFLAQFPVMLLGIVFYHVKKLSLLDQTNSKTALSCILLMFSGCMVVGMALHRNKLVGLSEYTLFGIWFFFLICSQYLRPFFAIGNRVFGILGKYSYPIYLFHLLIIVLYEKYIPNFVENIILGWIIKYIVVVAVSLVLALFLTRFVDEPLKKLLRRYIFGK